MLWNRCLMLRGNVGTGGIKWGVKSLAKVIKGVRVDREKGVRSETGRSSICTRRGQKEDPEKEPEPNAWGVEGEPGACGVLDAK